MLEEIYIQNTFFRFDTKDVGGFVFADQFLQLSTLLPTHYIYGLGERQDAFLRSTDWTTTTMWNYDTPPGDKVRIIVFTYGTHTNAKHQEYSKVKYL